MSIHNRFILSTKLTPYFFRRKEAYAYPLVNYSRNPYLWYNMSMSMSNFETDNSSGDNLKPDLFGEKRIDRRSPEPIRLKTSRGSRATDSSPNRPGNDSQVALLERHPSQRSRANSLENSSSDDSGTDIRESIRGVEHLVNSLGGNPSKFKDKFIRIKSRYQLGR